MKFYLKITCFVLLIVFSDRAHAIRVRDRIDIIGYGGYDQLTGVTVQDSTTSFGTFKGYDAGGALLVAFSRRRHFTPVIGGGAHYSNVSNSVSSGSNTVAYTLTSTAGTAHFGYRFNSPLMKFFIIGNGGYSDAGDAFQQKTTVTASKAPVASASYSYSMNEHIFYGGTVSLLIFALPFIKIGASGIYNVHSANLTDSSGSTTGISYTEISANAVLDINF